MSLNIDRSAWKRVALGDVVRHVTDRVVPETSGLERFLAGEHIPGRSLHITEWGVLGRDPIGPMFFKRFKPGHVLYVSRRTYLRKVAVPEFEGITGEKTFVLESIDQEVLLQEFLPFVLSAEVFHRYAVANSRGSVNPYLNWGELAEYEFDLPPIEEQKRIATLMWAIEQHLRASSAVRASLQSARSVWIDRTLEGGRWPSVPVADLVRSGPTNGKSGRTTDDPHGTPTLSISAIRDGEVRGGGSVKYINIGDDDVARFVIERDDFLVVRGNGNKDLTGRGGLAVGGLPDGCIYPDLLIRLRFNPDLILPAFAAAQWNSTRAHAALVKKAKSTNGIWKINGKDVKSHNLVTPPIRDQEAILRRLEGFQQALGRHELDHNALMALRDGISAILMGGDR